MQYIIFSPVVIFLFILGHGVKEYHVFQNGLKLNR